tara:strand:+ start:627 stop:1088 length:462 start_codon:yes stop_codon:yes gene_type:complete
MKIPAINEGVSLIANIGVIGSIIFLGLEMQQNTEMMQSQTRNSIVEHQLILYEKVLENTEIFDITDRLNSNLDVTETERNQLHFWILSQLRMWENEFYQYQIGLFDSEEFEARRIAWGRVMSSDINVERWKVAEETFNPDFRINLNEIIDEIS